MIKPRDMQGYKSKDSDLFWSSKMMKSCSQRHSASLFLSIFCFPPQSTFNQTFRCHRRRAAYSAFFRSLIVWFQLFFYFLSLFFSSAYFPSPMGNWKYTDGSSDLFVLLYPLYPPFFPYVKGSPISPLLSSIFQLLLHPVVGESIDFPWCSFSNIWLFWSSQTFEQCGISSLVKGLGKLLVNCMLLLVSFVMKTLSCLSYTDIVPATAAAWKS